MGEIDDEEYAKIGKGKEYYIQYYSEKLYTAKGIFEMEYRNESNGYYGGYVKFVGVTKK